MTLLIFSVLYIKGINFVCSQLISYWKDEFHENQQSRPTFLGAEVLEFKIDSSNQ